MRESGSGPDAAPRPIVRTPAGTATERRLLAIAARLFRQQGYSGTSTRDLAKAIGVRPASLYHYISSKESLLYEICEASLTEIHQAAREAVDKGADPDDRVRRLITAHVQTSLAARDMHATMLMEMRSLSDPHRETVINLRDAYEDYVRGVIRDAQEDGSLRRDVEAKYLCLFLLNLLNWSIFWYAPGRGLSAEQLGEMAADIFINGAQGPVVG